MDSATGGGARTDDRTPALLNRFRDGDAAGYEQLVDRYRDRLRSFIRLHTTLEFRRDVSVEDVFQETHLEALRCFARFEYRQELSFFFWLCGIARKRILMNARRLRRRLPEVRLPAERSGTTSAQLLDALRASGPTPSHAVELRENLDILACALEELPSRQRQALLLRYIEGESNADAARRMGLTDASFRVIASRGRLRLRERLCELLGG